MHTKYGYNEKSCTHKNSFQTIMGVLTKHNFTPEEYNNTKGYDIPCIEGQFSNVFPSSIFKISIAVPKGTLVYDLPKNANSTEEVSGKNAKIAVTGKVPPRQYSSRFSVVQCFERIAVEIGMPGFSPPHPSPPVALDNERGRFTNFLLRRGTECHPPGFASIVNSRR